MAMRLEELETALTFDDVMLVPQYSELLSRSEPDLKTTMGNGDLDLPIVSSPMNTVTEFEMAEVMSSVGGASVIHRFMSIEEQMSIFQKVKDSGVMNVYFAVGAGKESFERVKIMLDAGVQNICVDIAHGDSVLAEDMVDMIRRVYNFRGSIMAGNVCTFEGTAMLAGAGADIIKVGIGPGSMCKTRIVTGHGVPQISAIDKCSVIRYSHPGVCIVADGGIRNTGDMVKALAAGANAVMLGSMLAGTSQSPGEVIEKDGRAYKLYAGMASIVGRSKWLKEKASSVTEEGEASYIPFKGDAKTLLDGYGKAIKTGMTYSGAFTLQELREKAKFVRVTENGRIEGTPHGK